MRTDSLYKVEIYRFFHSFFIFICMAAGFLGILFLAAYNSDALLSDGTPLGSILIYLGILSPTFCKDFFLRILLLFVLFVHLCSGATLYVLLCGNPVVGGCLSFARFLLADAALQIAVSGPATGRREVLLMKWMVFNQWCELTNIESPLSREVIIGIVAAAIIEYGILQGILLWRFRISDV